MRPEITFCDPRPGMAVSAPAPASRLAGAVTGGHKKTGCRGQRFGRSALWGVSGIRGRVPPLVFSLLLGLALAPAAALAAPITGETQPEPLGEAPGPITLQDPAAPPVEPTIEGDADATVVEFSIVPSAGDPNKMETVIIVQQQGGKRICLNQSNADIISRSYLRRGDEPFDPAVPSELRGLSSGDSGELVGFNDIKVFIRPHSSADEFTDPDECFRVAEVEACFVADADDCDQVLQEGDLICVGDGISNSGCPVVDHANLMRQLRIIVALNQPLGETPIITAADVAAAPVLELPSGEPGEPGGGAPTAPTGPTDGPVFGGGGSSLVAVPNVIGLTAPQANGVITGVGLVLGSVTIQDQEAGLRIPSIIRPAHAQACEPDTVITQTPPAGTLVPLGTAVNIVLCAQPAVIPEPSSLALFALGLGLLILFTWSRRRLG